MESVAVSGVETAFELAEFAAAMVGETYRRNHPDATDSDVECAISAWWQDRPGAPDGDCIGRIIRPQ